LTALRQAGTSAAAAKPYRLGSVRTNTRILPNGEGHIQNLLSVYIGMDIFNFFPTFSKEKLGSDFKGNQGVNFKFAPNMSTIYSDE
jgi:hypothetical protein